MTLRHQGSSTYSWANARMKTPCIYIWHSVSFSRQIRLLQTLFLEKKMCQIRRQHGDEICGAVSLVTSVPIEDALQALKSKLQDDDMLNQWAKLPKAWQTGGVSFVHGNQKKKLQLGVDEILPLLHECMVFAFQEYWYLQTDETLMVSPLSTCIVVPDNGVSCRT